MKSQADRPESMSSVDGLLSARQGFKLFKAIDVLLSAVLNDQLAHCNSWSSTTLYNYNLPFYVPVLYTNGVHAVALPEN